MAQKKYASLSTLQTFLTNLKNLFTTVQIVTQDETKTTIEDITNLKIHKLSQEQYDDLVASDSVDENALYLTPDGDYTQEEVNEIIATHNHNNMYYTKTEINDYEFITIQDIDNICNANE